MSRSRWLFLAGFVVFVCAGQLRASRVEELRRAGMKRSRAESLHEVPDPIRVRHIVRKELGDQVAESDNFRVVYGKHPAVMEKIARRAEVVRQHVHNSWFGNRPYEWDGRTAIYLYATHALYVKKTGQTGALAHAQARVAGGAVYRRTISLPLDVDDLYEVVLPHEVTHSVMANRFNGDMPRWADEGVAVLSEAPDSHARLRRILALSRKKNELFDTEVLMHTQDQMLIMTPEYYAQGMSLVEFFVAERGRRVFMRFLMDGIHGDYKTSLKKHYQIDGYAELHRRWLAFAFPEVERGAGRLPDLVDSRFADKVHLWFMERSEPGR